MMVEEVLQEKIRENNDWIVIGLKSTVTPIAGLTLDESKIAVGQTMAFIVLAFSELVHVFNIRNNTKSIFKTKIFNNTVLIGAVLLSALLMLIVLLIPGLRNVFHIPMLPFDNILEVLILIFTPIVVVEIFKLLKIGTKD